jgi:hypothetical protein
VLFFLFEDEVIDGYEQGRVEDEEIPLEHPHVAYIEDNSHETSGSEEGQLLFCHLEAD